MVAFADFLLVRASQAVEQLTGQLFCCLKASSEQLFRRQSSQNAFEIDELNFELFLGRFDTTAVDVAIVEFCTLDLFVLVIDGLVLVRVLEVALVKVEVVFLVRALLNNQVNGEVALLVVVNNMDEIEVVEVVL